MELSSYSLMTSDLDKEICQRNLCRGPYVLQ